MGKLALLALALSAAPALADPNAPPLPAEAMRADVSYLTPAARDDNPLIPKTRDYQGVPLAGWMFYPAFLAEKIYNDNLALTSTAPRAAAGMRLRPDVYALRETGVAKTEVYAALDADLYPTAPRDNQITGALGLAQTWKPAPDLAIKAQAQLDRLGGFQSGGSVIGPNGAPAQLVAPALANRAQASLGVQKDFGRLFLGAAVNVAATRYDSLATEAGAVSQSWRDSVVTTLTQRAGYWLTPLVYGYTETSENWREYSDAGLRSQGYRAVAGLGSDRLSLFRGEVFAGYQIQRYSAPLPGEATSPVLGAKLYWYPTRALTFGAALDETFSESANPAPGNPRGDPTRDMSATFDARYQLHRQWSIYAQARLDRATALGASRVDDGVYATARLDYALRRDLDLSVSYAYTRVNSNAPGGSYIDDLASLGARYKF